MSRTVELVCPLWLFPCSHRSHRSAGLLVAMAPSWNRMKVGTSSRHLFLSAFHQKPIETICNMKQYEKIWHNWTIYYNYIIHAKSFRILLESNDIECQRIPSRICKTENQLTVEAQLQLHSDWRLRVLSSRCLHQLGDPSTSQRFLKGGTSMTGM